MQFSSFLNALRRVYESITGLPGSDNTTYVAFLNQTFLRSMNPSRCPTLRSSHKSIELGRLRDASEPKLVELFRFYCTHVIGMSLTGWLQLVEDFGQLRFESPPPTKGSAPQCRWGRPRHSRLRGTQHHNNFHSQHGRGNKKKC